MSAVSAGMLFVSAGISSIVSIGLSGAGIFYSRQGRSRVDRGETPKYRGLAQAGFVIGWISLVLAIVATIFWIVMIVLIATDEGVRNDFQDGFDNGRTTRAALTAGVRVAAVLA